MHDGKCVARQRVNYERHGTGGQSGDRTVTVFTDTGGLPSGRIEEIPPAAKGRVVAKRVIEEQIKARHHPAVRSGNINSALGKDDVIRLLRA